MTEKRFIEFATQQTDNGEINNGFQDIKSGEWYYTKDSENAKKICELLNELHEEILSLKEHLKYQKGLAENFRELLGESNIKVIDLNDENEQLKTQLQNTSDQRDEFHRGARENANRVGKLEKENEQLKQSYKEFEDECQSTFNAMNRKQNDLYRKNFKLKEENEQLKNNIREAYQTERTMIGKSVLKQLIDKME